jgi:hypothetical protein
MSPVFDKIFTTGPMREVLDLSVVRVTLQSQPYYLKVCPKPRFTTSSNNCSILDKVSAKRLRDHVVSVIVNGGSISTVCGKEISVVERHSSDAIASLYEKILSLVDVVRIMDLIPTHILKEMSPESCPKKLRELMVSLFREYSYSEHLGVPV